MTVHLNPGLFAGELVKKMKKDTWQRKLAFGKGLGVQWEKDKAKQVRGLTFRVPSLFLLIYAGSHEERRWLFEVQTQSRISPIILLYTSKIFKLLGFEGSWG
jgi:hypothetical protein